MTLVVSLVANLVLAGFAVYYGTTLWRRRRELVRARADRVVFPFVGHELSLPAVDAALRLAQAERATLVPVYLALVPLHLPLESALPRQSETALALLEAVERRAKAAGVTVDARIERGRSLRHGLRELMEHEGYGRMVVPAGGQGFDAADIAWLLRNVAGEIIVLRPGPPRERPQDEVPAETPGSIPEPDQPTYSSRLRSVR